MLIPDFLLLEKYFCSTLTEHLSAGRLLMVISRERAPGLGFITTGGMVAKKKVLLNGVRLIVAIMLSIPIQVHVYM